MNEEEISNLVYEILDRWELDEREIISVYKKELIDKVSILNGYKERMDEIENLIRNHAIGIQNVYNEFNDLKKSLELDPIKELIKRLKRMIKELES